MTRKNNIKIEEIDKGNPFTVPDHYFENFSIRMADKISQVEAAKAPAAVHAGLRPKMAVILAFGGVALFLLIVVFVNFRNKPLSSHEMVEAYRYSALQDLNDEQLAQIIAEKKEEQQLRADSTKQTEKYKDEIIEYLSNESIDVNTIIEVQ